MEDVLKSLSLLFSGSYFMLTGSTFFGTRLSFLIAASFSSCNLLLWQPHSFPHMLD